MQRTQKGFDRDVSLEGVKNVTVDSKTSVFADHARFSAYADLIRRKESAQVSIFHYARNNSNNVVITPATITKAAIIAIAFFLFINLHKIEFLF